VNSFRPTKLSKFSRRSNTFEADGCAPLHEKRNEVQNLIGYFKVRDGNGLEFEIKFVFLRFKPFQREVLCE